MSKKLTAAQTLCLRTAYLQGAAYPVPIRMRTGGAYARMVDRLAGEGLLDAKPPHALLLKGRRAFLTNNCAICTFSARSFHHRNFCAPFSRSVKTMQAAP